MYSRKRFSSGPEATTNPETERSLKALRVRYGRRVPTLAVQAWADKGLAEAQAKKRNAIADLSKDNLTINVGSLRATVMSSHRSGSAASDYQAQCEIMLLRLEVEHGPEIPISVVAALADSLEGPA
jgi:hypothetical protein